MTDEASPPTYRLTTLEAHVIGQAALHVRTTTYAIMKSLTKSVTTGFNQSPGTFYPIVRRLAERGLVAVEEGQNGSKDLIATTPAGLSAFRAWAREMDAADIVPVDPLRSKMLYLGLLPKRERAEMVVQARRMMAERIRQIDDQLRLSSTDRFGQIALRGALATLSARANWLDDVIVDLADD